MKKNTLQKKFIKINTNEIKIKEENIKFINFIKLIKTGFIKFFPKSIIVNEIKKANIIKIKDLNSNKIFNINLKKDFIKLQNKSQKFEIIYFEYKNIKYYFDSALNLFKKIKLDENQKVKDFINNYKNGLNKKRFEERIKILGKNKIKLKKKNYFTFFIEEIFSLLGFYEIMCIIIYSLEKLYATSFVLLFIFLYETNHLILENLKNYKRVKDLSDNSGYVIVYRKNKNNEFKKLIEKKENLVYGDLIEICENFIIPSDCVLIQGSLIVNDSIKKDFNNICIKRAIVDTNIKVKNIPPENILFSGTKCISSINNLNFNNLAIVLKTGSLTYKGSIVNNILFHKIKNNNIFNEIKKLFMILIIFSFILLIIFNILNEVFFNKHHAQISFKMKLIENLELILTLIRPQIPICFLNILNFMLKYLNSYGIYVINPYKIFECSKIKYLGFDPLMNITVPNLEDAYNELKLYDDKDNEINLKEIDEEIKKNFIFCSNIIKYKNELIGNFFKKLFYKLSDYEHKVKVENLEIKNIYYKGDKEYQLILNTHFNENIKYSIIKDLKNEEIFIYVYGCSEYFLDIFPNFFKNNDYLNKILFFKSKFKNNNYLNLNLIDLKDNIEMICSLKIPFYFNDNIKLLKKLKKYKIDIKLISKKSMLFNLDYCLKNELVKDGDIINLDYKNKSIECKTFIISGYKKIESCNLSEKFNDLNSLFDKLKLFKNNKLMISKNFIHYLIKIIKKEKIEKNTLKFYYEYLKEKGLIFYDLKSEDKKYLINLLKCKNEKFSYIASDTNDIPALKISNIGISYSIGYTSLFSSFNLNSNFKNILKIVKISKISILNSKIFIFYTIFFSFFMFLGISFMIFHHYHLSNICIVYLDIFIYLIVSLRISKNVPKKSLLKFSNRLLNKKFIWFILLNIIIVGAIFILIIRFFYFNINDENSNFAIFSPICLISLSVLLGIYFNFKNKKNNLLLLSFYIFNCIIFLIISGVNFSPNIFNLTKFIPNSNKKGNLFNWTIIYILISVWIFFMSYFYQKINKKIFN